jgi:hypothetical protein
VHQRPHGCGAPDRERRLAEHREPRVAGWRTVVALAQQADDIPGGVRLRFARDVDIPTIAALADVQQDRCQFITFTLGIGPVAVTLDITGPDDVRAVIDALVRGGVNDQRALQSGRVVAEPCGPAGCAPPSNVSVEAEHGPIAAVPTVSIRRSVT